MDLNVLTQIAAMVVTVGGALKLAYGSLKSHLASEFASKSDVARIESKIDNLYAVQVSRTPRRFERAEERD